jgi:hypothetical protein
MLNSFYGAFSLACFALPGLWLVVVQIRIGDWRDSESTKRMSYVISLNFLLPGLMGVLALVDPQNAAFWRSSFAVLGIGGAAGSYLASIFRAYDLAALGAGLRAVLACGRAWLPGCRAGWAGFRGPWCSPSWSQWRFRVVSRTGGPAGG